MFYPWVNQSNNQYAGQQQHNPHQIYQDQNNQYSSYFDRSSTDDLTTPIGDQSVKVEYDKVIDSSESLRNKRERLRVKQVNAAFALLREHLPNPDESSHQTSGKRPKSSRRKCRRISKVKTLRSAIQYINDLLKILKDSEQTRSD
ncbi:unnamed protein product [Hymenolepis diminuta]|uniref:BHLH domain-containing protein n=1 Tax=Hymenolepis diminuta TaxID=6216 RepID=A0A0R3S8K2_HYMDI|nr:unnamed protein product [Hymenolepis diminuta]VUZ50427.1 unnamed protein product [Hymenolepis diminuta]